MALSRRSFLGLAATGAAGILIPACSDQRSRDGAGEPSGLEPPSGVTASPAVADSSVDGIALNWTNVADAQSYDIELNGFVVAQSNTTTRFDITRGDGRTGITSGDNSVRVRGRAGAVEGPWSTPQSFIVKPTKVARSRGFDAEDDGAIALTPGEDGPVSAGTELLVGAPFAFGGKGKGLSMRCTDAANTKAYKNHSILPVEECWLRMSFSPQHASQDGKRVQIGRISDSKSDKSERIYWITGKGITSTSVKVQVPLPEKSWVQLQLGIDADGKVELWAFDGTRETLVGTGRSAMAGATKDRFTVGNHNPNLGVTYEAWIDDVAVGESRLPWLRQDAARGVTRPKSLVANELPSKFSFVFGSCTNSNHVPATGTALGSAADANPDFVLHLGDFGYLDSAAYTQTVNGYLATWTDLLAGDAMARLAEKPWIFICSDHDLGGNNTVGATVAPFAAEAFARYNPNDKSADGVGRYGSTTFDDGRVLFVWTEGVLHRSALDAPNAPGNTKLGAEQKAWLLDLLSGTDAKLVIFASETTVAQTSKTSWVNHPQERAEVLAALEGTGAHVRILSGDFHRARWAKLRPNIVEWGAAAMSEFAEGTTSPAPDVLDSGMPTYPGYGSRPSALEHLTIPEFNATTTYGWAEIDTAAHSARFELRANDGSVRVDDKGRPMSEAFTYG